ncbi:MAG: zinc-binding dehydrogenase, partial [Clostridiales bacterium]|nr:zinc-binding dehydrogenase [Clostridiales bacterium]
LAKLSGASKVLLSEPIAFRRETGLLLGADAAVDPINGDLSESVKETFGGDGADVIIECVGIPAVTKQALETASRGSTVLLFSVPKAGTTVPLSLDDVYRKELTVLGSMINPDTHAKAAALISSGKIDLEHIITHTYPLSGLYDAVLKQQGDESLKVIVEPQRGE